MTHKTDHPKRNIEGLLDSAQKKAEMTKRRAEEAIATLVKAQRPINFKTVAETAQISTAWLYANEDIKMRIMHLRAQQMPQAQVRLPPREQASTASKNAMIAALEKRVREQAEEIKALRKQLEVAYESLYKQ
jgi:hypothetical protein